MLTLLPVGAFVLCVVFFRARGIGWRASLIHSALAWGVMTVAITESLSMLRSLTTASVAAAWGMIDCLLLVPFGFRREAYPTVTDTIRRNVLRYRAATVGNLSSLVLGVALIVLLVGLTALVSPPNTATQYHMERIVHWIQNRTVAFYPTHNLRQLYMTPWAEYAMLQFHLLAGTDVFANTVQWFSMTGCVLGVTLLAQAMGATRRGQVLAAVLVATLPQGIIQGSSSQNDYVAAFWLLAFAYTVLAYGNAPSFALALALGSAIGLALLTKAHVVIFALAVFATWTLAWSAATRRQILRHVPVIVALVVTLNIGHGLRLLGLFTSPGGGAGSTQLWSEAPVINERFGVGVTFSNVIRNVAIHAATPVETVNQWIQRLVENVLRLAGQDASDPATTWRGTVFSIPVLSRTEFLASNPVHALLGAIAVGLLFLRGKRSRIPSARLYAIGVLAAFVLFCAIFKWQPWHARLHIGLFVLGSAIVATTLADLRSSRLSYGLSLILLILAAPFVLDNQPRPLLFEGSVFNRTRLSLYAQADTQIDPEGLLAAAHLIRQWGCRHVGFDEDVPAYPLLVALGFERGGGRVTHVGVTNPSAAYDTESGAAPCAVICPRCTVDQTRWNRYAGQVGTASTFGSLIIFGTQGAIQSYEDSAGQQFGPCAIVLSTGWYDVERDRTGWWRWTARGGRLLVIVPPEDKAVTLSADISSLPQPNTIEIRTNGLVRATRSVTRGGWHGMDPVTVPLEPGPNNIDFVSQQPPVQIATDPRELGFGLKNVRATVGSAKPCRIVQSP